jgi:hypothetical protein
MLMDINLVDLLTKKYQYTVYINSILVNLLNFY